MRLPVFMIANDAEIFARPGSPPQTDIVAVLAGASVIVALG